MLKHSPKKIVVTGGSGFLGTALVPKLKSDGHAVEILSRRHGVDLLDAKAAADFLAAATPDLVIHCAADVGGIAYAQRHPVRIFENNMQIGMNLVKALVSAGVKNFLNVMPNCIYPGHLTLYREGELWDGEIHPSVLAYGLPRKALIGLCRAYAQECGLKSAHLIFPNMYGPGDHMDPVRSHALGALMQKIVQAKRQGAKNVEIWGSGKPVREWIYVADAARAIASATDIFSELVDEVLNVGVGKGISILDSARLIAKVVGWNGEFVYDPNYPDGASEKRLDAARFEKIFGWLPDTPLEEGIRKTVAWHESTLL